MAYPVRWPWLAAVPAVLALVTCGAGGSSSSTPSSAPAVVTPAQPPSAQNPPIPGATPVAPPSGHAYIEDEQNTVDVFRTAAPSTVYVTQNQIVYDQYSMKALEVPAGTGSGYIWDDKGDIVTNYHVVDGARSLTVTLYDRTTWPAKFVGGDPRKDVAVLHIDAPKASLVPVALPPDGYEPEVGQKVLAIGNPFGLDHTLTTGVVSALGREVKGYGQVTIHDMIQTDASINPGNSGGPLLNSSGQLLGMNTMIYSESGSSAGIGFAVPIATVRHVVEQVITKGRVQQVGMGVSVLDDRLAQRYGIDGVAVLQVVAGSPAEKAGLQGFKQTARGILLGDVIVGVDGKPVHSFDDLYDILDAHKPGDVVKVTLLRDGQKVDVQMPLVEVSEHE